MWLPAGEPHPDAEAAIELCESIGLSLDPWQEFILRKSLQRKNGKWAAFEIALVVPRQNGKNVVIEAMELAGLFLLNERLIVHSAHQFDTSLEAFRRITHWLENTDWLRKQVKRIPRAHGEEGVELKSGQRLRFRTRTKGGGRGFTSDRLVLDEAMILAETAHGALLPTLSARPDPQVVYTASAVDRLIHDDGVVLSRIRGRALEGGDPRLAYFEWSLEGDDPAAVPPELAGDPAQWAKANPGLGLRISSDRVEAEKRAMDDRTFAVERLGVGDWHVDGAVGVVDLDLWDSLCDTREKIGADFVFAFDALPDRSWSSVVAASVTEQGLVVAEVAARDRGLGWLTAWLPERVERHRPAAVVCDGAGPAASLVPELERRGVAVKMISAREYTQACGRFIDLVSDARLRHRGQAELRAALRGATRRPLGDSWAWSRRSSGVDITPLVATSIGTWYALLPQQQSSGKVVFL